MAPQSGPCRRMSVVPRSGNAKVGPGRTRVSRYHTYVLRRVAPPRGFDLVAALRDAICLRVHFDTRVITRAYHCFATTWHSSRGHCVSNVYGVHAVCCRLPRSGYAVGGGDVRQDTHCPDAMTSCRCNAPAGPVKKISVSSVLIFFCTLQSGPMDFFMGKDGVIAPEGGRGGANFAV